MPEMLQGGPQAPGRGRRRRNIQGERVLRQRLRKEGAEERGGRGPSGTHKETGGRGKGRRGGWFFRKRLGKEGAGERGRRVQGGPRSQAGRRVKARGESWGRHPRGGAGLGRPIQKMRVLS